MPILLQLIFRRLIVLGLSVLAFFGINPEINIPTEEEARIQTEERREIVQDIVSEPETSTSTEEITESEEVVRIPIPKENILDRIRENITQPDTIKTQPPVIEQPPIKTEPPIEIPPQTPIEAVEQPEVELPEDEIVIEPPVIDVDTTEENSISNAVVNIVCVRHNGNKIHLTTGSGVIISPRGVVLTNTHVAQFFLLDEFGYECSLRRENIPLYGFEAEPIYISEAWVEDNFLLISNPSPTGTGEDDYALLRITKNTNPALPLPSSFAHMEPNTDSGAAEIGDVVTAAGYPGGHSGVFDLDSNVDLVSERTRVKNEFTFQRTTIDVFSTGDTSVARRGASGGGVFEDNELIGLIVTTSPGSSPTEQVINALTLDYINRDLKEETGRSLNGYLSGNLIDLAKSFQSSVAPHLTELLSRNL